MKFITTLWIWLISATHIKANTKWIQFEDVGYINHRYLDLSGGTDTSEFQYTAPNNTAVIKSSAQRWQNSDYYYLSNLFDKSLYYRTHGTNHAHSYWLGSCSSINTETITIKFTKPQDISHIAVSARTMLNDRYSWYAIDAYVDANDFYNDKISQAIHITQMINTNNDYFGEIHFHSVKGIYELLLFHITKPTSYCALNEIKIFVADPTQSPTDCPTNNPTPPPSPNPSVHPTTAPTTDPSFIPTNIPTKSPSLHPTVTPTMNPTVIPTVYPSYNPSNQPTTTPTANPFLIPTFDPTISPTMQPTDDTTLSPTESPTNNPSNNPTYNATVYPSNNPSKTPTDNSSMKTPTKIPSVNPSQIPISSPSQLITNKTKQATSNVTYNPTQESKNNVTTINVDTTAIETEVTTEKQSLNWINGENFIFIIIAIIAMLFVIICILMIIVCTLIKKMGKNSNKDHQDGVQLEMIDNKHSRVGTASHMEGFAYNKTTTQYQLTSQMDIEQNVSESDDMQIFTE